MDIKQAELSFREVLDFLDFNVNDPHMVDTPRRFVKALVEMTTRDEDWNFTMFDGDEAVPGEIGDSGIVLVRDIPFISLCAHHLAVFTGVAHVAYIPQKKIVGLSKLARVVTFFAKKPQVQERLGQEVADYLTTGGLDPLGVAVILRAEHSCMSHRGAMAHGSSTITSCLRGAFYSDPSARAELTALLSL